MEVTCKMLLTYSEKSPKIGSCEYGDKESSASIKGTEVRSSTCKVVPVPN
jgi:hypothetical protein